jgi:hypothetical protein
MPVTLDGGAVAEESPDGTTLYYTRVEDGKTSLWRRPVAGGVATPVADRLFMNLNFAVGQRAVYLIANGDRPGQQELHVVEHASGRRSTLVRTDRPAWAGMALSPDEGTLIVTVIDTRHADLMLAEPVR